MIRSLHIENIAVVRSLDIDFSEGMTVLSGETGAGKSIIIDSLGLLLGNKADKELIKKEFGLSKNAFKRAVGKLLKDGKVVITEKTIELTDK